MTHKLRDYAVIAIVTAIVLSLAFCSFTPMGIELKNWYSALMKKTDLNTKYAPGP